MYTTINFKTKKALVEAVKRGDLITVYQPNSDLTGAVCPRDGVGFIEAPHYPEPHRWYAQVVLKGGYIIKVK
jgi:hypothetical protein